MSQSHPHSTADADGHCHDCGSLHGKPRRRALTLHPEWAYAIATLGKDIENRTWEPPAYIIGDWLAIHGGVSIGGVSHKGDLKFGERHREACEDVVMMAKIAYPDRPVKFSIRNILDLGRGIVAIAKIGRTLHGQAHGWYIGEPSYGWKLEQVRVLAEPVPCKGAQGLWFLPDDVAAKVRAQLAVMT